MLGTPLYMAPEQVHNAQVGPAADLYALGVTMYEMLSGRTPHNGDAVAIAAGKLSEALPPLETRTGLEALTLSLLARKPEERPRSAREVVAAIDDVLRAAGVSIAPGASPPPPAGPQAPSSSPPNAGAETTIQRTGGRARRGGDARCGRAPHGEEPRGRRGGRSDDAGARSRGGAPLGEMRRVGAAPDAPRNSRNIPR